MKYSRLITLSFMVFLFFTVSFTQSAHALPGDLDLGFDGDGKVLTDFSSSGFPNVDAFAMAIQTDGKILVGGGGTASDFFLARYNPDGSLDATFGTGGFVTTDVTSVGDFLGGITLQADGKIVAVGTSNNSSGTSIGVALVRYNANGSLDTTFGAGGKVTDTFGSGVFDGLDVIAVQTDGKIIVAGQANNDFGLMRLNANGSLDTSFGTGGKVTTDFSGGQDSINGIVIQADGKLVAGGNGGRVARSPASHYPPNHLRPGSLAPNFGDHGPSDSALAASSGWRLHRPAADRHAARCASREIA